VPPENHMMEAFSYLVDNASKSATYYSPERFLPDRRRYQFTLPNEGSVSRAVSVGKFAPTSS
jgi:hypothetical protein